MDSTATAREAVAAQQDEQSAVAQQQQQSTVQHLEYSVSNGTSAVPARETDAATIVPVNRNSVSAVANDDPAEVAIHAHARDNNPKKSRWQQTKDEFALLHPRIVRDHLKKTWSNLRRPTLAELRPWTPVFIAAVILIIFGILFSIYNKQILNWLEDLAKQTRDSGARGWVIVAALIALTSIPPVFGYSTMSTFAGFVYGSPKGWLNILAGATVGSLLCFILGRTFLKRYARYLQRSNRRAAAAIACAENRGLVFLTLVRLAPYPFNCTSILLSLTRVPVWKYVLATAIGQIKMLMHVYVGSGLSSLVNMGRQRSTKGEIAVVVIGVILCILITLYIYVVVERHVEESRKLEAEEQLRRMEEEEDGHDAVDHVELEVGVAPVKTNASLANPSA